MVSEGAWWSSSPRLLADLSAPVAPDGRFRQARGQDLLGELAHGDLVVVGRFAARHGERRRPGHHRGNQQRGHVLRDSAGLQRPSRDLGHGLLHPAGLGSDIPGKRGGAGELEETASREHDPTPSGHRCCLSRDSLAQVETRRAPGRNSGSRAGYGSRPDSANHTAISSTGGPRANEDDEEQPPANGQTAKQASSGVRTRFLDSRHRVPTAPHVATVATKPATSRSLGAFAQLRAHRTSSHRYRHSRVRRTGPADPNRLGRPTLDS
jgi:hypothetical protein